jgi:hypothetical protein
LLPKPLFGVNFSLAIPEYTAGCAWAALLAALGLANLVIALRFDFATWAWFVSVGAVGAKPAAFALQYGVFRMIVRQRIAQSAMANTSWATALPRPIGFGMQFGTKRPAFDQVLTAAQRNSPAGPENPC